jgi:hypothetical protein
MAFSPAFDGLTYLDANGIPQPRFRNFDGIGISGSRSARLNFALDQRLQLKFRRGDVVQRLDNLMSWNISGAYNFLWREQRQAHPLSTLSSTIRIQPPRLVSADVSWVTDVYSQRPIRSLGYNIGLNMSGRGRSTSVAGAATGDTPLEGQPVEDVDFAEPWTLGLAFSSSGGYSSGTRWVTSQTLNGVAHYGLTRSWRMDYAASFDVTNHELLTHRFGLTRDLHCWQITFSRTFFPGQEAEYFFRINIKDQREIYLERGTREMSFGGIR